MESWYQKFLVPPPIPGENRTRVNVSISVTNIMDINEQVFIFRQKRCQTTCHCVVLSWWFCLVSQAGVFQVQFYLVMSWLDSNIIFRVRRILNNCICTWAKLKWQGSKCWDSFRQLPFLKFCSCSCCLLTELEEPNKYEHPSDKWTLQNMDARADFCQHGKISPAKNTGYDNFVFFSCEIQMTGCQLRFCLFSCTPVG